MELTEREQIKTLWTKVRWINTPFHVDSHVCMGVDLMRMYVCVGVDLMRMYVCVSFVGSLHNYIVEPSGFERGWQAEEILGATEVDKEILFLIRWYVISHSTG